MDSSVNINSEVINFKQYISSNKDVFTKILKELEVVSKKTKDFLKSTLTKDDRIDNQLLELNQFQTHGFAWFETYRIGLRETYNWYSRLTQENKDSEKRFESRITSFNFFSGTNRGMLKLLVNSQSLNTMSIKY